MAGLRVHFVMSRELVERIDGALVEGESRGEFVRRAVEQALGSGPEECAPNGRDVATDRSQASPAPAEQPRIAGRDALIADGLSRADAFRQASSLVAKRDVRPVPKAGEK